MPANSPPANSPPANSPPANSPPANSPPANSVTAASSRGPTVADVLDVEPLRRARPRVVAGAGGLGNTVRWTHVAELLDIAHLLRGGEVLLSTGVAFPSADTELAPMLEALAAAGTSGIVVELGRRYQHALPEPMLSAANRLDLPVIELRREASFVHITEAVHALVVGAQLAELRASEEVHRTFTELSIEGADAETIVRHTARMANAPTVLENLNHQVLAFDPAGQSADHLLDRWEARSRAMASTGRTTVDVEAGWVTAVVGARGTDWGRLVVVVDNDPTARHLMVAERAAAALSLGRLVERDHDSLEHQSHRALLTAMVEQSLTTHDLALRASGLGVMIEDRALIGVIVRTTHVEVSPLEQQATVRSLTETVTQAVRAARVSGLVGGLDERSVGLLLAADDAAQAQRSLTTMANRVSRTLAESNQSEAVVAAGSIVTDVLDVRRSFLEAAQVADVARFDPGRAVHRLADVGLSGLLHLLRNDERVQTFVERELGAVLRHDARNRGDLLRVLRTYLESGRNKSAAASEFGLSRPAFYERIRTLEALLDVDLDDVGACLTLHVAMRSLDAVRSGESAQ